MATNIPPHNLTEVINACICILDDPECTLGGFDGAHHRAGLSHQGHYFGPGRDPVCLCHRQGRLTLRARTHFEEFGQNRTRIIVTEIPYQVNKRMLIKNMADQVK